MKIAQKKKKKETMNTQEKKNKNENKNKVRMDKKEALIQTPCRNVTSIKDPLFNLVNKNLGICPCNPEWSCDGKPWDKN